MRGDRLDVAGLFGGDVLVVDVADVSLRRFLLDLPAHTVPTARILGPLTYLANENLPDAFDLALRHDAIVSNERDLLRRDRHLDAQRCGQGPPEPDARRHSARCPDYPWPGRMPCRDRDGERERSRVRGRCHRSRRHGDAFVAGVAWGMAQRWPWPDVGRFANAVGALACCSLGAQASLPTLAEVEKLLATGPAARD